jgi:hypothetical protein
VFEALSRRKRRCFFEHPVATRVVRYGNIAHVWSTYESRETSTQEKPMARGINSFQSLRIGYRVEGAVDRLAAGRRGASHPAAVRTVSPLDVALIDRDRATSQRRCWRHQAQVHAHYTREHSPSASMRAASSVLTPSVRSMWRSSIETDQHLSIDAGRIDRADTAGTLDLALIDRDRQSLSVDAACIDFECVHVLHDVQPQ